MIHVHYTHKIKEIRNIYYFFNKRTYKNRNLFIRENVRYLMTYPLNHTGKS